MQNEELRKAIDLIKSNQKVEGEKILIGVVQSNPNIELAWLWLSVCKNDPNEKIECLSNALRINPTNNHAQEALDKLMARISRPLVSDIVANTQSIANKPSSPKDSKGQSSSFPLPHSRGSNSIEFIPATCPNCGGELRVPKSMNFVKCMYCGHDIIIRNPNQYEVKVELKKDLARLLDLAQKTEEAQNYEESYKYYSQILENDSENRTAWFGKARAVAEKCSLKNQTLDEAISYIKTGFQFDSTLDQDAQKSILTLVKSISSYIKLVIEDLDAYYLQNEPANSSPDPIYQMGKTIAEKRLNKAIDERFQKLILPVYRAVPFCWQVYPSKDVGEWIFNALSLINQYSSGDRRDWFFDNLSKTISDAQAKYPELQLPKKKACFIATATMGNPNHPYIITLRMYRDDVLSSTKIGQGFVRRYYLYSPKYAKMIESSRVLKLLSLLLIVKPAYLLAKVALSNRHRIL